MPDRPNARYTPLDAPGPLPLDMIRAALRIRRDPLGYLQDTVARYGDLVAFPMPRLPVLLINDPQGAHRVLQENHRNYDKQTVQYRSLSLVTGSGLLTSDGATWRRHRRLTQPAFGPAGLSVAAGQAVRAAEGLRSTVPVGVPSDLHAAVLRATLDLVGGSLFGADLGHTGGGGSAERVVQAVDQALRVVVQRARSPLSAAQLNRLPTPSRRRLRRSIGTLDAACRGALAERRLAVGRPGGGYGDDVLGRLLAGTSADAGGLTDVEVRDELVTFVIAGQDTVGSAITWALHLLARAPRAQADVHAELDQVLQGRPPTAADLPRLRRTRAVVDETLRLYPPAWVLSRRALAADRVAGVDLPAGTLVLISPWLLHRRATSWPEPAEFRPERFLDRSVVGRRGDYLPFGAGPRLCIGREVALVEAVLLLATILRDRSIAPPAGAAPPAPDAQVVVHPRGGLPLVLSSRPPAA